MPININQVGKFTSRGPDRHQSTIIGFLQKLCQTLMPWYIIDRPKLANAPHMDRVDDDRYRPTKKLLEKYSRKAGEKRNPAPACTTSVKVNEGALRYFVEGRILGVSRNSDFIKSTSHAAKRRDCEGREAARVHVVPHRREAV